MTRADAARKGSAMVIWQVTHCTIRPIVRAEE